MEGLTIVDGIVAVIVVLSALLAYSRGLVREVLAILGWIVAALLGSIFAPKIEPMITEIPILNDFIGGNCELSIIAAFAAVFAVALIIMSFFTPLFSSLVQRSALGGVDQGLGFLFGVLRGIVLVAIAYFVYQTAFTTQPIQVVEDSRSARVFDQLIARVEERNPEEAVGWVRLQYDNLIGYCDVPDQ